METEGRRNKGREVREQKTSKEERSTLELSRSLARLSTSLSCWTRGLNGGTISFSTLASENCYKSERDFSPLLTILFFSLPAAVYSAVFFASRCVTLFFSSSFFAPRAAFPRLPAPFLCSRAFPRARRGRLRSVRACLRGSAASLATRKESASIAPQAFRSRQFALIGLVLPPPSRPLPAAP